MPSEKCYKKHHRCTEKRREKRKERDVSQLHCWRCIADIFLLWKTERECRGYEKWNRYGDKTAETRVATRLHSKKFGYMKNADTREETRDAVAGSCKFSRRAKTSRRRIIAFSSAKFLVERDFPAGGKFAGRSGVENGRSSYSHDEFLIRREWKMKKLRSLLREFAGL